MRKFVHESRAKHLVFRMFLLAHVDHSLLLVRFVVLSLCGILFNYYLVYFSITIYTLWLPSLPQLLVCSRRRSSTPETGVLWQQPRRLLIHPGQCSTRTAVPPT